MSWGSEFTLESLLDGCRKGDRKAQESLYATVAPRMMAVCMRYARDSAEAEDILQMGFVKVFGKLSEFRNKGSFEGWIRRIMVNTAIEVYRRNLRSVKSEDIEEVYDYSQSTFDMNGLEVKDLLKMIRQLPAGYRLVFNLYAIEGFSHKEIADQLNITEGTSKSQLSRARAVLKERILKMETLDDATYGG